MNCTITKVEKESVEKVAKYEMTFYQAIFSVKKIPTIRILLYGDPEKYKRAEITLPSYARGSNGFYSPGSKQIKVLKNGNFVQTCYHEMSHLFFHAYMAKIPTWINEGLATYFERAKIDSTGVVEIMEWKNAKIRMKELIRKKKFDLNWLVSTTYKKFHKRNEIDHYYESWAIVNYLMKTNRKVLVEIIKNIHLKNNSEDAIESCYEGGLKKLEKDLILYYK